MNRLILVVCRHFLGTPHFDVCCEQSVAMPNQDEIANMTLANLHEHWKKMQSDRRDQEQPSSPRQYFRHGTWCLAQRQVPQSEEVSPTTTSVGGDSDTSPASPAGEIFKPCQMDSLKGILQCAADEAVSTEDVITCQDKALKSQRFELEKLRQQIASYAQVMDSVAEMVGREIGIVLGAARSQHLDHEQVQRLQSVQAFTLQTQQKLNHRPSTPTPQRHTVSAHVHNRIRAPEPLRTTASPRTRSAQPPPVSHNKALESCLELVSHPRARSAQRSNPAPLDLGQHRSPGIFPGPVHSSRSGEHTPRSFKPANTAYCQPKRSSLAPVRAPQTEQRCRGTSRTPPAQRCRSHAPTGSRSRSSAPDAAADKLNGRPRVSSAGAARRPRGKCSAPVFALLHESQHCTPRDAVPRGASSRTCKSNGYFPTPAR
mmetsp:Transcript_104221/g.179631  ORF Transcript_104221/g.179631 Transcript_104221/m.179631 type:complete len:428 (-) Transcript_104221:145-1428(-)